MLFITVCDIIDVLFVECLSLMGRVLLTALLFLWITCVFSDPVRHVDYTTDPDTVRNCIERDCECELPKICDVEGGQATCEQCPPGSFQPHTFSTRKIVGTSCTEHDKCAGGW